MTIILTLIVIASVFMCGIVLMQESKGGGLASSFSGYNQIMGVRKTTDFIEKVTWALAIIMVVLSILSTVFIKNGDSASNSVVNTIEQINDNVPALPAAAAEEGVNE